jgi:hypothetical protein
MMPSENSSEAPTLSTIREKLQQRFGKRACLWQLKVAHAFLESTGDIICIAGTGMGKTLAFWAPLAFTTTGIQIVVTPLNQLGRQSVDFLEKAGIQSISISADTVSSASFRVRPHSSPVLLFEVRSNPDYIGDRKHALPCNHYQPGTADEARWRI